GTLRAPAAIGNVQLTASRGDGTCPIAAQGEVHLDAAAVRVSAVDARCGDDSLAGSMEWQHATDAIAGEYAATVTDLGSVGGLIGGARWPVRGRGTVVGHIGGTVSRPFVGGTLHGSDFETTTPWPTASGDIERITARTVTATGVFGIE